MKPNIRAFALILMLSTFLIAASCFDCTAAAQTQSVPSTSRAVQQDTFRAVKATGASPLYVRYLAAGDALHLRGDDAKAKDYWIASLGAFEKETVAAPGMFPRLEHRLLNMYPDDWSKLNLTAEKKEKMSEEQVSVLRRLVRLTRAYRSVTGSTLSSMAEEGLTKANSNLIEIKKAAESVHQ